MLTSTGNSTLPSFSVSLSDQPIHHSPYRGRETTIVLQSSSTLALSLLFLSFSPWPLAPLLRLSLLPLDQRDTYCILRSSSPSIPLSLPPLRYCNIRGVGQLCFLPSVLCTQCPLHPVSCLLGVLSLVKPCRD